MCWLALPPPVKGERPCPMSVPLLVETERPLREIVVDVVVFLLLLAAAVVVVVGGGGVAEYYSF